MQMIACPLCGSDASRMVCDCSDVPPSPHQNTLPGLIYRCRSCEFLYKETTQHPLDELEQVYQFTVEDVREYFGPVLKGYDLNSAEIRLYTHVLEELCRRLGPAADGERRLLDVGCGTGALLDRSRAFGFAPYGVELNPHCARYAQEEFGLPVVAGELSTEDFDPESFDAITMMDLIEHVPAPLALLDTARQLLKPGGFLVIYTPNHRSIIAQSALALYRATGGRLRGPAHILFGTMHVCFFDHRTLPMTLDRTGYVIDTVRRIRYDPQHQGDVNSQSALAIGLEALEAFAGLVGLPFRLLAFAHKPAR